MAVLCPGAVPSGAPRAAPQLPGPAGLGLHPSPSTQRLHGSFRKLLLHLAPRTPCPSPLCCRTGLSSVTCDSWGRLSLVGLSSNTLVWFLCPCASESVDFQTEPANGARVGAEGSAIVIQGLCSSQVVELQMLRKKPHWPSSGGEIVPLPLGFVWSFLPVHPLLHLTVYICFIVHRFVNIIPLPEVFVHNLGFVALFIQPLSGMFP